MPYRTGGTPIQVSDRPPATYISPRCSVGDHACCPDNPGSELAPPAGVYSCGCTGCAHGRQDGPHLPAEAFG